MANKGCQKTPDPAVDVGTQFPEPQQSVTHLSQTRIQRFVRHVGPVIESLLLHNLSGGNRVAYVSVLSVSTSGEFKSGMSRPSLLQTTPTFVASALGAQGISVSLPNNLFVNRQVTAVYFSPTRPLWLLVAYSPAIDLVSCNDATSLSGDHWLRNKGLLCYWNLTRAGSPDKILCCDGRPHRCTLAPDHAHLCFAGLQEGSVALWDTREDELLHRSVSGFGGGSSLLVRSATFSTDDCAGHLAPIVALRPLLTQQDASLTQQKSTFQIASLDQDLVLIVWTVIELKEGNLAGSKHDLGLALGARVKMMKSVVVEVKHINARSCFDFMCKPADTNEFFLALSSGNITCCRRFGELPDPCTFSSAELPDPCLCLQFSPFVSNMFVAGFESGSISLFNEESSDPVLRWSNVAPGAVISIQWSFHRPSVFIALAATGEMLVFDLLVDEQLPVQSVSLGYSVPSISISSAGHNKSTSQSLVAFPARDSSTVLAIVVNDNFALPKSNELQSFQKLLSLAC